MWSGGNSPGIGRRLAWEIERSKDIPHGIRYALTLHAPSGKRILGYDNAHAVKVKKYSGQRLLFDHKHRHTVGIRATTVGLTADVKKKNDSAQVKSTQYGPERNQ